MQSYGGYTSGLKIRARADWSRQGVGLFLIGHDGKAIGVNVEMKPLDECMMQPPTVSIDDHHAQILMDDLWSAGFRPTEGKGSAGSFEAQGRHLEDMRKIAGGKLKIDLK